LDTAARRGASVVDRDVGHAWNFRIARNAKTSVDVQSEIACSFPLTSL
jgi:hypothetical protein